jgi:hypothetical protein
VILRRRKSDAQLVAAVNVLRHELAYMLVTRDGLTQTQADCAVAALIEDRALPRELRAA